MSEPLRATEAARRLDMPTKDLLRLILDHEIRYVMVEGIAHVPEDDPSRRSFVGVSRRRAASVARRGSDIGISLRVVEVEFTAEGADLGLDGHDNRQPASVDEVVTDVLEHGEQLKSLVEGVPDVSGWRSGKLTAHPSRLTRATSPREPRFDPRPPSCSRARRGRRPS